MRIRFFAQMVYTTACASPYPAGDGTFLPLTVNYQERFSAAGKTRCVHGASCVRLDGTQAAPLLAILGLPCADCVRLCTHTLPADPRTTASAPLSNTPLLPAYLHIHGDRNKREVCPLSPSRHTATHTHALRHTSSHTHSYIAGAT